MTEHDPITELRRKLDKEAAEGNRLYAQQTKALSSVQTWQVIMGGAIAILIPIVIGGTAHTIRAIAQLETALAAHSVVPAHGAVSETLHRLALTDERLTVLLEQHIDGGDHND